MLNMLIKYGGFLIGKYMDSVLPQCNAPKELEEPLAAERDPDKMWMWWNSSL